MSKVVAALLTYPCQNVRACQQAATDAAVTMSAMDIVRREGVRGLYRGVVPYLMHCVPNACLVFVVYEAVVKSANKM